MTLPYIALLKECELCVDRAAIDIAPLAGVVRFFSEHAVLFK